MGDTDLCLDGFEMVDTPMSVKQACLILDEFDEDPSPLKARYCRQLTEYDYEKEGESETEKALLALITDLEKDPKTFEKVLRKKRQEELESGGIVSLFKSRLMSKIQGEKYKKKLVSEEECRCKLDEVTQGMVMVYNYSQEARGRRFSRRLAAKREEMARNSESLPRLTSAARAPHAPVPQRRLAGGARGPPPPPPCPPPMMTPLKERCLNVVTPNPRVECLKRQPLKRNSTSSLVSLHEELMSSNPLTRLRSTHQTKSPGGTPDRGKGLKRKRVPDPNTSTNSLDWTDPLNSSEPLSKAFMRIMEYKFRNVRSPSPAVRSPLNASSDFTP